MKKNHNHQVGIFLSNWGLSRQNFFQRGYKDFQNYIPIIEITPLDQVNVAWGYIY